LYNQEDETMSKYEVLDKVQSDLEQSRFERVLLFGTDNVRYAGGITLPPLGNLIGEAVAVLLQRNEAPVVFVPAWLKETFRTKAIISNVQVYSGHGQDAAVVFCKTLRAVLERTGAEKSEIGVTERRVSPALVSHLRSTLPDMNFTACDQWIAAVRMVKTAYEQQQLVQAARKTDHGLCGAAHHVMVYAARPEKGLSEIIRVHCIERGLDMIGYESLAIGASGEHTTTPWPEAPYFGVGRGKYLQEHELVRMEIRTSFNGYWSDAARMLTMGPATAEQSSAYQQVVSIREKALGLLRPGAVCSEIAQELQDYCKSKSIPLQLEHGFGHGIGVTPIEPPFIDSSDATALKAGMVLVISPTVRGPAGGLVRSYDTAVIENEGGRLVGWYKDWNEPYKAVASYQHGGG
jgi:Xaa-Pro dipeptidase